jgi:hypothetical protein
MRSIITKTFIAVVVLASCNNRNTNPNILSSQAIAEKEERVAILKKEITSFSSFTDAEFFLVNANGFTTQRTTIPGASSFRYSFIIKIDTNYIKNWTAGMKEVPDTNIPASWLEELPNHEKSAWQVHSTPMVYMDSTENVVLAVYREEGLIFKKIAGN